MEGGKAPDQRNMRLVCHSVNDDRGFGALWVVVKSCGDGTVRRLMSLGCWSTNWSVAAGWSMTIALQVGGGDECSTEDSSGSTSCTTGVMYKDSWPSLICGT